MKPARKILSLLACLSGAVTPLLAQEHPQSLLPVDPKLVPAWEWELVKDRAEYTITGDRWFAGLEDLSTMEPAFGPINGYGDCGGGIFANLIVHPETKQRGPKTAFLVLICYRWAGFLPKDGPAFYEAKRFFLTERITDGATTRYRNIGTYVSTAMMKKFTAEILRQSHLLKKPLREKEPDGRWNVEKTATEEKIVMGDAVLLERVGNLAEKGSIAVKPGDGQPWSSICIYPSQYYEEGTKFYRVAIYKSGKMKIHEIRMNLVETISRDLGWFEDLELWHDLRFLLVENTIAVRKELQGK